VVFCELSVQTYILVLAGWGLVATAGSQQSPRDAAIELAKSTLVQEVGAGADNAALVSISDAIWRDSSLGCPQRGTVYSPAVTSGYRVTLSVRGTRYVVHVGPSSAVVCGGPAGAVKRVPPLSPDASASRDAKLPATATVAGLKLAEQARADLAKTLGVEKDAVTITLFRPATWPDASLGCPVEGRMYTQQQTKGFTIELASGGKSYEYHSDMNHVVPCDSVHR
jgi:hypothetical protein